MHAVFSEHAVSACRLNKEYAAAMERQEQKRLADAQEREAKSRRKYEVRALPCPALPCPALHYPAPALPCPALPCTTLPRPCPCPGLSSSALLFVSLPYDL